MASSSVALCVILTSVLCCMVTSVECILGGRPQRTDPLMLGKSSHGQQRVELPSDLKRHLLLSHSPSNSLRESVDELHRTKRSAEDCGMSQLLEHDKQDLEEQAETIQAIWVDKDEILIAASDNKDTGATTLYKGRIKQSVGIFHFNQKSVSTSVYPNSLQASAADHRDTVVMVSHDKRYMFVSRNSGETWDKHATPTSNFDPTEELYLSNHDPRHMIIRSNDEDLYISESAGERWTAVAHKVILVELAMVDRSVEYIYYSTASPYSDRSPLYRMNIADRTTTVIDHSAYRFRVDNYYLFVSRKNHTHHKTADDKSRRLYVATNYTQSNVKFTEVQLPSLKDEQFYVVMATHEQGAFIHVYDGSEKTYGNLYVSDSSGTTFSLSLENHLFKVVHSPFNHYTVHDFYEVVSAKGVFITSVHNDADDGHVSMITYDNGGLWQRLPAPSTASCSGGSCSLHLYLKFSRLVSPFYNLSVASGPLSIKSAPGIIIAHGSVGPRSRSDIPQNIYVSSDGGHSWKETGIPAGTYVYGIADYGNIITVAPDSESVQYVWVSHDRGDCFVKKELDATDKFGLSRGLLIDPSAASLYGFLMGVEGTAEDDSWRIITVYFGSLLTRQCGVDDYEKVKSPSCVMGYKAVYNLTKSSSLCFNGPSYNYEPISREPCPCSYVDYECDFGFNRTSNTHCSKLDEDLALSQVCPPGTDSYYQSDSGFRLVPGDICTATDESQELLKKKAYTCVKHEEGVDDTTNQVGTHGNKGLKIFGAIVIIIAILLVAGMVTYCVLKCKKDSPKSYRDRVYYQRLPLDEPGSKFSANDEDTSSDEDLITAT